ncbi:MAG: DUF3459 domain-containing protein, partial [Marinoscillum sp.]
DLDQFLKNVHTNGRDNARTPMHWDDSENAGFTEGSPWLKLNPNHKEINVAAQDHESDSILNFYREMIHLRKAHSELVYCPYKDLDPEHKCVFTYSRKGESSNYLVVLNFSSENLTYRLKQDISSLTVLKSNYPKESHSGLEISLRPWEAILFQKAN